MKLKFSVNRLLRAVCCLLSTMDDLSQKIPLVFRVILQNLDDHQLVKLREVTRNLSNEIDNERYYWIRIMQNLFEKHSRFFEDFSESWNKVIVKTTTENIKQLAMITNSFVKIPCRYQLKFLSWHPLHVVADHGDLQLLNHVIEKTGDNNPKLAKGIF